MRFVGPAGLVRPGVLLMLSLAVLVHPTGAVDAPATDGAPLVLPASFVPGQDCRDCAAASSQLDLWPDGAFHLASDQHGPAASPGGSLIGRWRRVPGADELLLYGGHEAPLRFRVVDARSLQAVDHAGRLPGAGAAAAWHAREAFVPADLELRLHGMFSSADGGARFEECLTGRSYEVAAEGEYAALEREYLRLTGPDPGSAVLASFDGALRQPGAATGLRSTPTVVVRRLTGLWPGQTCERAMSHASLSNQYWRVDRLRGRRLEPVADAGDMFLILRDDAGGYVANAGCGRYSAAYRVEGPAISFAAAASHPDCPASLAPRQAQLQSVLAAAAGWAIQGQVLELFDAAGDSLAALEAVYFN